MTESIKRACMFSLLSASLIERHRWSDEVLQELVSQARPTFHGISPDSLDV